MPENKDLKPDYVFHDNAGYHFKVNGTWFRNLSKHEAYIELLKQGVHTKNVQMAVYTAPYVPPIIDVDFIGGKRGAGYRRWIVDGRPVCKDSAYRALRETGLSPADARLVMKIMERHPNEELRRELQIPA